jgi:MFS family permease
MADDSANLMDQKAPVKLKLPTNKRMYVFIATCLAQFMVWSDEIAFINLVPFWAAEYSFNTIQIAAIQSAYLLGYFPMLLFGGVIADFIGAKKCLLIAVGFCGGQGGFPG